MKAKLDDTGVQQMRVRVFISRITHLLSESEIARGFDISLPTLYRYKSEHAREISRESSRRQQSRIAEERLILRGKCETCRNILVSHARCGECEILLHPEGQSLFGTTPDGIHCETCFDRKGFATLLPPEEVIYNY